MTQLPSRLEQGVREFPGGVNPALPPRRVSESEKIVSELNAVLAAGANTAARAIGLQTQLVRENTAVKAAQLETALTEARTRVDGERLKQADFRKSMEELDGKAATVAQNIARLELRDTAGVMTMLAGEGPEATAAFLAKYPEYGETEAQAKTLELLGKRMARADQPKVLESIQEQIEQGRAKGMPEHEAINAANIAGLVAERVRGLPYAAAVAYGENITVAADHLKSTMQEQDIARRHGASVQASAQEAETSISESIELYRGGITGGEFRPSRPEAFVDAMMSVISSEASNVAILDPDTGTVRNMAQAARHFMGQQLSMEEALLLLPVINASKSSSGDGPSARALWGNDGAFPLRDMMKPGGVIANRYLEGVNGRMSKAASVYLNTATLPLDRNFSSQEMLHQKNFDAFMNAQKELEQDSKQLRRLVPELADTIDGSLQQFAMRGKQLEADLQQRMLTIAHEAQSPYTVGTTRSHGEPDSNFGTMVESYSSSPGNHLFMKPGQAAIAISSGKGGLGYVLSRDEGRKYVVDKLSELSVAATSTAFDPEHPEMHPAAQALDLFFAVAREAGPERAINLLTKMEDEALATVLTMVAFMYNDPGFDAKTGNFAYEGQGFQKIIGQFGREGSAGRVLRLASDVQFGAFMNSDLNGEEYDAGFHKDVAEVQLMQDLYGEQVGEIAMTNRPLVLRAKGAMIAAMLEGPFEMEATERYQLAKKKVQKTGLGQMEVLKSRESGRTYVIDADLFGVRGPSLDAGRASAEQLAFQRSIGPGQAFLPGKPPAFGVPHEPKKLLSDVAIPLYESDFGGDGRVVGGARMGAAAIDAFVKEGLEEYGDAWDQEERRKMFDFYGPDPVIVAVQGNSIFGESTAYYLWPTDPDGQKRFREWVMNPDNNGLPHTALNVTSRVRREMDAVLAEKNLEGERLADILQPH